MKNEKLVELKKDINIEPIKYEPVKCEPIKCETIKCEPKRSKSPHLCEVCKQTCVSFTKLEIHKRIHTAERPYSCSSCTKTFRQKTHFVSHQRIHTGEKPYSCEYCKKTFRQKTHLVSHQRIHTCEKPYSCEYCTLKFRTSTALKKHEIIHNDLKPYSCTYCTLTFKQKAYVRKHESVHVARGHKIKSDKSENIHFCKFAYVCKKEFIGPESLKKHEETHKVDHMCQTCGQKCASPSQLKSHSRIHTGEKPYSCSFCTLKFRQIAHVQNHEKVHITKGHIRKYNESDMIHFCKVCSKDFIGPENLRKHEELHGNTVSHLCPTCGKEFNAPSKLEIHKRVHTGEKPFSCTYCTVKFRSKGNVRNHEKVHIARGHKIQKNESEMLHFCKHCKQDNITGKKAFLDHKKLHTKIKNPVVKSYSCKLCNYASSKWNLKRHIESIHQKSSKRVHIRKKIASSGLNERVNQDKEN